MTAAVLTSMLVLQRDGRATRPLDRYFAAFDRLAACGLPIDLYLDPALAGRRFAPGVNVLPMAFDELPARRATRDRVTELPPQRNAEKDTADYLAIVNAKTELVARSVARHPDASVYAWVDFGLFHVIRDDAAAIRRLRALAHSPPPGDRVVIPGCTAAPRDDWRAVDWRFCGGFFYGSAAAIRRFAALHVEAFRAWLPALTWEVNVWGRLEARHGWDPCWYAADHDDRILASPWLRD